MFNERVVRAGTTTLNSGSPSVPTASDVTVWAIPSLLTTVTTPPCATSTFGVV